MVKPTMVSARPDTPITRFNPSSFFSIDMKRWFSGVSYKII
jgi:hypothetical protein